MEECNMGDNEERKGEGGWEAQNEPVSQWAHTRYDTVPDPAAISYET
jgi:hypothetical protein